MALVITDDRNYKDIADAIRMGTEKTNAIYPHQMPNEIKSGYSVQYNMGYNHGTYEGAEQGRAEATEEFNSKHFSQIIKGDGTTSLTFNLPFEPDFVSVFANSADARTLKGTVSYFDIDLAALGQIIGKCGATAGKNGTGNYENRLMPPATALSMYQRADDGTVTISNVATASTPVCYFANVVDYYVLASKYDLPPLKTQIEESVRRLPDTSCTAYYQQVKIDAALTTSEWEALMAEKPNCTFELV